MYLYIETPAPGAASYGINFEVNNFKEALDEAKKFSKKINEKKIVYYIFIDFEFNKLPTDTAVDFKRLKENAEYVTIANEVYPDAGLEKEDAYEIEYIDRTQFYFDLNGIIYQCKMYDIYGNVYIYNLSSTLNELKKGDIVYCYLTEKYYEVEKDIRGKEINCIFNFSHVYLSDERYDDEFEDIFGENHMPPHFLRKATKQEIEQLKYIKC